MDASVLRNKLDLYGVTGTRQKLGVSTPTYGLIKPIFCEIIPANLSGSIQSTQAGTEYANVTHRLRCRKQSIKDLSIDMYFMDKDNLRYDIEYFQPDYKNDDFWEIMLKVKYK